MTTVLTQYIHKQEQLKKLQAELDRLRENDTFQTELDFKNRLEALIQEYGKSSKEVVALLTPKQATEPNQDGRKRRALKTYKHAHTGEILETRSGNNKKLKSWKEEHGSEAVESWLVSIE